MKKTLLTLLLLLVSIFSLTLGACFGGGDDGPVANAELDEYNQIVSLMKDVFTKESEPVEPMSAKADGGISLYAMINESAIDSMFNVMVADSSKKESSDADYYAYGIDFSTMTARIAGYAANHFFKLESFYNVNILMDYGGSTIINACVQKEGNTIKTYLFTTFENSKKELFKEYNYAEINFTSQEDFNILVVDYVYNSQDVNTAKTMIYASSEKDFFLLSSELDNPSMGVLFFNKGEGDTAYIIQGDKTNTINNLLGIMDQNFALSTQEKNFIGSLYNTEQYSINFSQVTQAKTELGVLIDMSSGEVELQKGFISNKNAEDLVGRKTLQGYIDDGEHVENKTLTIPEEFNYLSGGIFFDADIDTLVIPSTIKGLVVYDRLWDYSILDDDLCFYDAGDNYDDGRYKNWGGSLVSYVSDEDGNYMMNSTKPFKKYILLDENGMSTNETDAFVLDEIGNLWIKDSNGEKNYLWGFVSEPASEIDTFHVPSPFFVTKDRYIKVDRFVDIMFIEALKNVGKLDEYASHFKHLVIDGYVVEQDVPLMGLMPGFALIDTYFLKSHEGETGSIVGFKWDLETFTINNIVDGALIDLTQVFCSESTSFDQYGIPSPKTICQAKVDKVILNGNYNTITYVNGYSVLELNHGAPSKDGQGMDIPMNPGGQRITETYAISNDYELNGNENAYFSHESVIYGKKVVEVDGDLQNFPVYPDIEKLVIKSSVTQLNIYQPIYQIGMSVLPEDRKLTIEFENISGIEYDRFFIYDLMETSSNRVEKVIFNNSELFVQNLVNGISWMPGASWLEDIVNSNKFAVEYAEPLPGEQEFLTNFSFDSSGIVSIKDTSLLTTLEVNDNFLTIIKQLTGKELAETRIELWNMQGVNFKVIVNLSKEFLDDNNGQIPAIYGASVVELTSEMKVLDDLTGVLDRIVPDDGAKLIFNGTKQEFIDRAGSLGEQYITRLVYIIFGYYGEIVFADNQAVYRDFGSKTLAYEDERIKISLTFGEGADIAYTFIDKTNSNVGFTNATGDKDGYEGEDYWSVTLGLEYNNSQKSYYSLYLDGITYEREVIVPHYLLKISYHYGYTEFGDYNYIYGEDYNPYGVDFVICACPSTITIS